MSDTDALPGLLRAYAAVLARRPAEHAADALPPLDAEATGVLLDPAHVARYAETCGLSAAVVPITYPFVRAFPLVLSMLARPEWPLRLPGLVHLATRMTLQRPLDPKTTYRAHCAIGAHAVTTRGMEFDLTVTFDDDGGCVWTGTNRILARRPGARGVARAEEPPPGETAGTFAASVQQARAYARVSGDWNPIHLGVVGARLFGFRRPIAHGMWTLARSLAVLGAARATFVDATFTAPLILPSQVEVARTGDAFHARGLATGRVVLRGSVR